MENLTPPVLEAVRELHWRIASGHSMREALRLYLDVCTSPFAQTLREWWTLRAQDKVGKNERQAFTTHLQRAVLEVIERGIGGQPTLEHLKTLEQEIELAAQAELEAHIGALPFKVLLPLLFFQFPAYLILLLGPLLRDLSSKMGG
jgi:hypothetical protein